MTSTRMRPDQDVDEYLSNMDSCRVRLNACDPLQGPTDRQYEDIILQALPSEYDRIRQTHLERRDVGLADTRRMMAATYADNLSCSESSKCIADRGTAMQGVDRDRTSVLCHYCDQIGHFKRKCHSESNTSSSSGSSQFGIMSNNNMVNISKRRADGGKTTVEAAEAVCGVHTTRQRSITTPTAVSKSTKPAATLMWPPPELSASKESTAPTT